MLTLSDVLAFLASPAGEAQRAYATRDRIGGSRINALRIFLHTYAGGACVVCGLPTLLDCARSASNYAEVGHLLPASGNNASAAREGFTPGNVANFCHACNAAAGDYAFSASDVDATRVPLEWPTLRKVNASDDGHAQAARAARAARGLPF